MRFYLISCLIPATQRLRSTLLALSLCFSCVTYAEQDIADPYGVHQNTSDYDPNLAMPWLEREIKIDRLPQDDALTELVMDTMPMNMRLYADLSHMIIDGEDLVTRLWLVARSKQGAYNGTYEGFRCATGEYKIYAHANPKRREPLRMVQLPQWREIKSTDYRRELTRDYLCNDTQPRQQDEVMTHLNKNSADYDPSY